MQEHKEKMAQLNKLFTDLTTVGYSKGIVINYCEETPEKFDEEEYKKTIDNWDLEISKVENEFYEFCKKNKSEYYENNNGLEVFKVNCFYFGFTFGKDMIFSFDFTAFEKLIPSRIVKIDR